MLQLVMNTDVQRAVALIAVVLVIRVLFRKYWTSIRDVPGPFFASFSSLWRVYHLCKGHIEEEIFDLHKRHGMIVLIKTRGYTTHSMTIGHFVRIADNEVSVSHPDAVKQLLQANIPKVYEQVQ